MQSARSKVLGLNRDVQLLEDAMQSSIALCRFFYLEG
jgi:hypothetical protein